MLPIAALGALLALLLLLPLGHAAPANDSKPGQRIDLKVLLLSADGTEPGFGAWKAALDREGVPYDTFVAYTGATKVATLTDERLADYGANRATYQAVILASGDLGRNLTNRNQTTSYLSALTDAEWASARQVRAHVRDPAAERLHRAVADSRAQRRGGGASQDGRIGQLTAGGQGRCSPT